MTPIEILVAIVVGTFLILIGDSIRPQRERLWGPGRKARIQKAEGLAKEPAALTVWALKEGLIVAWLGAFGFLLSVASVAFMLTDHIREVPLEGVAGFIFPAMLLSGTGIVYIALRGSSQLIELLESLEESEEDAEESEDTSED